MRRTPHRGTSVSFSSPTPLWRYQINGMIAALQKSARKPLHAEERTRTRHQFALQVNARTTQTSRETFHLALMVQSHPNHTNECPYSRSNERKKHNCASLCLLFVEAITIQKACQAIGARKSGSGSATGPSWRFPLPFGGKRLVTLLFLAKNDFGYRCVQLGCKRGRVG